MPLEVTGACDLAANSLWLRFFVFFNTRVVVMIFLDFSLCGVVWRADWTACVWLRASVWATWRPTATRMSITATLSSPALCLRCQTACRKSTRRSLSLGKSAKTTQHLPLRCRMWRSFTLYRKRRHRLQRPPEMLQTPPRPRTWLLALTSAKRSVRNSRCSP